jgi:hypothetical protein
VVGVEHLFFNPFQRFQYQASAHETCLSSVVHFRARRALATMLASALLLARVLSDGGTTCLFVPLKPNTISAFISPS